MLSKCNYSVQIQPFLSKYTSGGEGDRLPFFPSITVLSKYNHLVQIRLSSLNKIILSIYCPNTTILSKYNHFVQIRPSRPKTTILNCPNTELFGPNAPILSKFDHIFQIRLHCPNTTILVKWCIYIAHFPCIV